MRPIRLTFPSRVPPLALYATCILARVLEAWIVVVMLLLLTALHCSSLLVLARQQKQSKSRTFFSLQAVLLFWATIYIV